MGIVNSKDQVKHNVIHFQEEVERSKGLQDRLPYNRGWYAIRGEDGEWLFGPSKFIGYTLNSAEDYLDETQSRDGRKTEAQLKEWFTPVDKSSPLYSELNTSLCDFLDRYQKTPSRSTRISVIDDLRDQAMEGDETTEIHAKVIDLIIEISHLLPSTKLRELRSRLTN